MDSWHPGFKWHAYRAHIQTLFLLEILDDALTLLQSPEAVGDPAVFADTLREEIRKDREAMLAATEYQFDGVKQNWVHDDVPIDIFYKAPNYCHTARLPAEIRALGILTGDVDPTRLDDRNGADTELNLAYLDEVTPKQMPLVYDKGQRQACRLTVQNDYKDFFFASGKYNDYASVTVPTDSEIGAYGKIPQLKGLIMVCPAACGWRCPKATLDIFKDYAKDIRFKVNGEEVYNVTQVANDCGFLQRADGKSHVWDDNGQGRFEVSAKIFDAVKYLRLSSVIVW